VELLIVLGIITLLIAVVGFNIIGARSSGRNAEVRAHVQTLKLALARAGQADPSGTYPGVTTWRCLKPSGFCWRGQYREGGVLNTFILTYTPSLPTPPGTKSGEYRHDAYLYSVGGASVTLYGVAGNILSGYTGPILVWWQEKPITDCNGQYLGQLDTGVYYCAERLIQ